MRIFITTLLSTTLLLILFTPSNATTCDIIVNPNQTIKSGIDQSKPEQTVCVKGGTYTEPAISITTPNITLRAYNQEPVILDGQKIHPTTGTHNLSPTVQLSYAALIRIEETAHHVTLDGIEVRNSRGEGIRVYGPYAQLKNIKSIWSAGQGILVRNSHHVLVDNAYVKDCSQISSTGMCLGARFSDNITIQNSTVIGGHGEGLATVQSTSVKFFNNTIYDNEGAQIMIDNTNTLLVERNHVFYTLSDLTSATSPLSIRQEIYDLDSGIQNKNLLIKNNLVVGSPDEVGGTRGTPALSMSFRDRPCTAYEECETQVNQNSGFDNWKIIHNTLISNSSSRPTIGWFTEGLTANSQPNNVFANNIVMQTGSDPRIVAGAPISTNHWTFKNNFYNISPPDNYLAKETDEIINPNISMANLVTHLNQASNFNPDNYKLTPSSPAINSAAEEYLSLVPIDHFNSTRPHGPSPDIGFHEFGGTPTTPQPQKWDLNSDNTINLFDFSWLLNAFGTDYSFPSLKSLISSL